MLHSLVRVSRRVGCSHLNTNNYSTKCDLAPGRADSRQQTLHAVPEAVPKRTGGPKAEACAASYPQSFADFQTDGYKFQLES